MKKWIKILLISLTSFGYYILSNSGSNSLLLFILLIYFELCRKKDL